MSRARHRAVGRTANGERARHQGQAPDSAMVRQRREGAHEFAEGDLLTWITTDSSSERWGCRLRAGLRAGRAYRLAILVP